MDQIPYWPFIKERCPGRIKMWRMSQAYTAAMISSCSDKWNPADRAERRRNERKALATGRADMKCTGIRDKSVADMADRRENDVKKRVKELRDGRAPHVRLKSEL